MPAISGSAGWGQVSWSPRSSFGGSKDTNKFPSFSENWKRWFPPSRRLSNAGRRRRVSYARAATFHGMSGDPRHNTAQPYCIPSLSVSTATSDLPGIRHALAATRHLLEMYRRQFSDDKSGRRLQRLDRRLLDVDQQLQNIAAGKK